MILMSKYILVTKKHQKESFSTLDKVNIFLSPALVLASWYMYIVTREDRYAFGSLIGEHVSNFFGSAMAMYLATTLTTTIENMAEFDEIKKVAQFLQVVSAIALLAINLNFEVWDGNSQIVGDLFSAVLAIVMVWASTRRALTKLEAKPTTHFEDDLG